MLGNIGNMLTKCMLKITKCMQQVTKGHLLGVSDYYVMYRQRAPSVL